MGNWSVVSFLLAVILYAMCGSHGVWRTCCHGSFSGKCALIGSLRDTVPEQDRTAMQ
jgi:hypothetical protein